MAIPIAFVDLETTGATAATDRITEVGIVQVDGEEVRHWSSLINPQTRISGFIERLTGISNDMVAAAPTFGEVAAEVMELLRGRLFIAHNASFDYGFLKNEFKRAGLDFRAQVLCTVKLSRRLYPRHAKHSLDSLIERHGLAVEGRHRALADAKLIHQFWNIVHREMAPDHVAGIVDELASSKGLPEHLDPSLSETLPEGHGVYTFLGAGELPLFVGKSRQLRKKVLSHFAGDRKSAKNMDLAKQVRRIDWIETEGEVGSLLRETALLNRLSPVHNRKPRKGAELLSWRLRQECDDRWRPELIRDADGNFGREPFLFGLFGSCQEAEKALAAIANKSRLCRSLLGLEKKAEGNPCSAHLAGRCRGACVGAETVDAHGARLMAALAALRVRPWPFPGPAIIREGRDIHVIDVWRHLGTIRSDDELGGILAAERPAFDADIYRILLKIEHLLKPMPKIPTPAADARWATE